MTVFNSVSSKAAIRLCFFAALIVAFACENAEDSLSLYDSDEVWENRANSGCEGKCSPSCQCGKGEVGCKKDRDCESGLYCSIREGRDNKCKNPDGGSNNNNNNNNNNNDNDNNNNDDSNNNDNNSGKNSVYTTESAPDLDTSDRTDFKNIMVQAGYKDLGDTRKCSLSQFQSLVQRKDIKTLYHASHGSKGKVWLMDEALQCSNSPKFSVENIIFATCLTLKDNCWKNQMGPTSNNIFGYTKVSFDGIANKNAIAFAKNISSGQSYIRAWYASNTSLNALKDRWCAYVREGGKIVEYSAQSGNTPKVISADLMPVHADEIVFVSTEILGDSRDFSNDFQSRNQTTYQAAEGESPKAKFYLNSPSFLQSEPVSEKMNLPQIAASLAKTMPEDAFLEEITPLEADGSVVAHRIRFGRFKDSLEVRTGGPEHHKEYIINGGKMVASSVYWPKIIEVKQSKVTTDPLLTVQETALELADELVMITRNSVAILDVKPCYGSYSTGDVVPAHCFKDTEDTIWVVDATTGELIE